MAKPTTETFAPFVGAEATRICDACGDAGAIAAVAPVQVADGDDITIETIPLGAACGPSCVRVLVARLIGRSRPRAQA